MNKNISKIVLALTMIGMISTGIYVNIRNNQNELKLIDIQGSKSELKDATISYQYQQGIYKATQVDINADKIDINNNAKLVSQNLDITDENIENRDVLANVWSKERVYKDESTMGVVDVEQSYDTIGKVENITFNILEKNLKNSEIKEFKIDIKNNNIKEDNAFDYLVKPIKYEDELYIGVLLNNYLYVYKIDLENEKGDVIYQKQFNDVKNLHSSIAFTHDSKIYFVRNNYVEEKEMAYIDKQNLISYDIKEDKLETIELEVIKTKDNVASYGYIFNVEDNNLQLVSELVDNENVKIYINNVNLSDNSQKIDEYTIPLDKDAPNISIDDFKYIEDKLYLVIEAYQNHSEDKFTSNLKSYIYVLDKDSSDVLYKGEIQKGIEYANISIQKR